MQHTFLKGAVAGAAGTLALDTATYVDMIVRGRPPSEVPEKVVSHYAEQFGVDFGDDPKQADNRRSATSSLLGYATGITGGIAYGVARRFGVRLPVPVAGLLIGAAVMAVTDTASTKAGATDPKTWSAQDWISDAIPHAVYGVVTASTFDSWSRSQRL